MKFSKILFLISILFIQACQSQNYDSKTSINYIAQTRGFSYTLILKNNIVEINNNNKTQQFKLYQKQVDDLENNLDAINFEKIKSNISTDDLALDKAIKGILNLTFHGQQFTFEFNHNNPPKEFGQILSLIEKFGS